MGFMDKIKGMVNPDKVDDNYDDEYVFDGSDDNQQYGYDEEIQFPQQQSQQMGMNNGYQQQQPQRGGNQGQSMILNSSNLELKVVRPEKYDSTTAQKIADHLLNRRTVVLNLEATNKESARRLIDFRSGVAYSIDGYIQRVANNTFVVVPNNVDVSGEQLQDNTNQNNNQRTNPDVF